MLQFHRPAGFFGCFVWRKEMQMYFPHPICKVMSPSLQFAKYKTATKTQTTFTLEVNLTSYFLLQTVNYFNENKVNVFKWNHLIEKLSFWMFCWLFNFFSPTICSCWCLELFRMSSSHEYPKLSFTFATAAELWSTISFTHKTCLQTL